MLTPSGPLSQTWYGGDHYFGREGMHPLSCGDCGPCVGPERRVVLRTGSGS